MPNTPPAMTNRNAVFVDHEHKARFNQEYGDRLAGLLRPEPGTRCLEVGCGGAELSAHLAANHGLDCWGVEPFPLYAPSLPHGRIATATAAAIPHPDASFDLVIAKDLLEHVDDIDGSVADMLRVSRRHLFIMCPNYLYPYEAHFKVPFIPFLPKTLARLWLRLLGKSAQEVQFINHINYVTKSSLVRALRRAVGNQRILAIIDLQSSKKLAKSGLCSHLFDRFINTKVELLVVVTP